MVLPQENREIEDMDVESSPEPTFEERIREFEKEEEEIPKRIVLKTAKIVIIRLKKCILPPQIGYISEEIHKKQAQSDDFEPGEIPEPPKSPIKCRSRSRSPIKSPQKPEKVPISNEERKALQRVYLSELNAYRSISPPSPPKTVSISPFCVSKPVENVFEIESEDDIFACTPVIACDNGENREGEERNAGLEVDDEEGYYVPKVGEGMKDGEKTYVVQEILGKGVYSCVVRVMDTATSRLFAVKIMRRQDTMHQSGLTEIRVLSHLQDLDPLGHKHTLVYFQSFLHNGHLCLVMENMAYNLRELIGKYGPGVGLSISAVKSYTRQLLLALSLLKSANFIHCDLKPDNILITSDLRKIKLADFGTVLTSPQSTETDLLVARYYRPPEVVLAGKVTPAVDMWSAGCTVFELYTGNVLFPAESNGHLLQLIMQLKGIISKKIRAKCKFSGKYFDTLSFSYPIIEKNTGKEKIISIPLTEIKKMQSIETLILAKSGEEVGNEGKLLASLIEEMVNVDPEKRISPEDALKHPFLRT